MEEQLLDVTSVASKNVPIMECGNSTKEKVMWGMLVQKGCEENLWQVSAWFDDGTRRLLNHICKGWFQCPDETEIVRQQLQAVRIMQSIRPNTLVRVTLQGGKGYCPKSPIPIDQLEKELLELI